MVMLNLLWCTHMMAGKTASTQLCIKVATDRVNDRDRVMEAGMDKHNVLTCTYLMSCVLDIA